VLLGNKMGKEIVPKNNTLLFHQQAKPHIEIMNMTRNVNRTITAIMHQNATAVIAIRSFDVIFTVGWTVDKVVLNVEENEP